MSNPMRWVIVFLCSLVCLLDGYDVLIAPVSVPVIAADWGVEAASFAVALTATVFGMAIGAVFLAPLGDRFGRRSVITASFAFVGGVSLLTPYFSTTVTELALFRLVTGLALGASIANCLALASEVALPRLRSRVTVCVFSMSALGSVFGGMVAPIILETMGWEGLYIVGGVIPLFLVPVLFFCIPGSARLSKLLSIKSANETVDATQSAAVAAAAPSPNGGVIHGLKMLLAPQYRSKTLLLWVLYFICLFTMYVMSSWLPTLIHLYGWSIDIAVRTIMVFSLGGVMGGFAIGWLVDNGHTAIALSIGFCLSAIAMGLLPFVPAEIWIWMILITVIGGGIIGVSYAIAALAAIVYPPNLRAGGIGTASAMGRLGATIAPIVGGWFIARGATVVQILTGLIWPVLLGLIIVFLFSKVLNVKVE